MAKSNSASDFNRSQMQAQGLVEYAILIALISLIAIAGLALFGGSVSGGLIKVCAALGFDDCQAASNESEPVVIDSTPTTSVATPSSVIPTATQKLSEPEPTRGPVSVFTSTPTKALELKTLKIKVVVSGKAKANGMQVVVYGSGGEYVTEGVTDEKGNVVLSVPDGSYTVATFYEEAWQKDGPFSPGSKENVIHR